MKPRIFAINIPNFFTVLRILITPLFVIFLTKDMRHFALAAFVIAGISDGLDGLIARYFNQKTVFGAYLDPIADKLLLTAAFVSLAILEIVPSWLSIIVITRDVLISVGIILMMITDKTVEIKPTIVSKFTTVFQLVTIFIALIGPDVPLLNAENFRNILFWSTGVLTIASGLHYIHKGMNILQNGSKSEK